MEWCLILYRYIQFIVTYLEHSNSEVRDAVIRLILVLYRVVRKKATYQYSYHLSPVYLSIYY